MADIEFTKDAASRKLIDKIVKRARIQHPGTFDPLSLTMDISATHANGNPLRLVDLLAASDFDFAHDIFGISNCLDRSSGKLTRCFSPRFSRRDLTAA